ncbi:MAG: hypothetical protein Q9216_000658 [Gyalolechia sp. 2 TL-2023]
MSYTARERQRATTNTDTTNQSSTAPIADIDYRALIDRFDPTTLQSLLFNATKQSTAVASAVVVQDQRVTAAEAARVVDFDSHSKSTSRILINADKPEGSDAWEASFDVTDSIRASIDKIVSSTFAYSSFGTKRNALYTLREKGETIALDRYETCGKEVCNALAKDDVLDNAMLDVMCKMNEGEQKLLGQDREWVAEVEEPIEMGENVDMYAKLGDVLREIEGAGSKNSFDSQELGYGYGTRDPGFHARSFISSAISSHSFALNN